MTYSILALDKQSGRIGCAAATGNLCVGGWVLRADSMAGASASQGAYPSTIWGEDALTLMHEGKSAKETLAEIVGADAGRDHRQLAVLSLDGGTAFHTGVENVDHCHAIASEGVVVSGNMLTSPSVIDAIHEAYCANLSQPFEERLIRAIEAGDSAGSDFRGLMSAALKIVAQGSAPYDLRIDYHETPIKALRELNARAQDPEYKKWLELVPSALHPARPADDIR